MVMRDGHGVSKRRRTKEALVLAALFLLPSLAESKGYLGLLIALLALALAITSMAFLFPRRDHRRAAVTDAAILDFPDRESRWAHRLGTSKSCDAIEIASLDPGNRVFPPVEALGQHRFERDVKPHPLYLKPHCRAG